jgi:hypothetical protein
MKFRLLIIWTVLLLIFSQAVEAQKVLLLQKPGKTKRFLYEKGDKISILIGDPEFRVSGEITFIDDSLCTINKEYTFQIAKVNEVTRPRTWFLYSWKKLYLASAIYAGGSMINHAINDEQPIFDNTIPWVSGSFIVLGTTAYLLRYRHCKMEDQWRLKVLDFDIFNE